MPTAKDEEALIAWMTSGPIPDTTILARRPFTAKPPPARESAVAAARRLIGPDHREAVGPIASEIEAILRIYAPAPSAPGEGTNEAPISHVG